MKTIVTVKRHIDGRVRIYEVPGGTHLQAGTDVMVEYRDGTTLATTTQATIEVEDDILAYFTPRPLRNITTILYGNAHGADDPAEATETPTDDE